MMTTDLQNTSSSGGDRFEEDLLDVLKIFVKNSVRPRLFQPTWDNYTGFFSSFPNHIQNLYDPNLFTAQISYRKPSELLLKDCVLVGTILYGSDKLQSCLETLRDICTSSVNSEKSQYLALLITFNDSEQHFAGIHQTLANLKDIYLKVFFDIRIMYLGSSNKSSEEITSSKKSTPKSTILSKKITKPSLDPNRNSPKLSKQGFERLNQKCQKIYDELEKIKDEKSVLKSELEEKIYKLRQENFSLSNDKLQLAHDIRQLEKQNNQFEKVIRQLEKELEGYKKEDYSAEIGEDLHFGDI